MDRVRKSREKHAGIIGLISNELSAGFTAKSGLSEPPKCMTLVSRRYELAAVYTSDLFGCRGRSTSFQEGVCNDPSRREFLQLAMLHQDGFSLFAMSTQNLCKATGAIEVGDTVALLAGTLWPAVLRPEGENYRDIGRAYADSIMKG